MRNERRQPFSRRALVLILGYGVISLLFSVLLAWMSDAREEPGSIDTDTFSESAIGHKAMLKLLKERGYWARASRWESGDAARHAGLLVVAEPHVMLGGDEQVASALRAMLASSPRTLLVLPKRDGFQDDFVPTWIGSVVHVPEYDVQHVLDQARVTTTPVRVWRSGEALEWESAQQALSASPLMPDVQLLRPSAKLEPLIWAPQGVLFARVRDGGASGGELFVLSDPDILANHGLHRASNAELALGIVEHSRTSGRILFDEVLHGHEQPPTLWQQLLEFPLVLGTTQVFLLLFFALWAGMVRFGPVQREARVHAAGKGFFIENTAELLTVGNHSAYTLERYVWMMLHELGFKLNAPAHLSRAELVVWLQEQADARGVEIELERITRRAEVLSIEARRLRPQRVLDLSMQLYRFREAMIDES